MPERRVVDLRSDTITQPTQAMRDAMRDAPVGDDVFGEDPTVNRLESLAAERMGKDAALFLPSGTMANQSAIMVHTRRHGEMICEEGAHVYLYEGGAPAALSGILVHTLPGRNGVLEADQVRRAIRPDNPHHPRTTLVAVENTHNRAGGTVWTPAQTRAVAEAAHERKIPVHLDGARIFNAAVAQDVPAARLARDVDSVMFSLSKGLSAPVGSMLCGEQGFVQEARRVRKLLGGGMRQAGFLAAAGIVALESMVERLKEDHANARQIAAGLAKIPGVTVDLSTVQTNIVLFEVSGLGLDAARFCERVGAEGVRCLPMDTNLVRMVTQRHVSREDALHVVETCRRLFEAERTKPAGRSRRRA